VNTQGPSPRHSLWLQVSKRLALQVEQAVQEPPVAAEEEDTDDGTLEDRVELLIEEVLLDRKDEITLELIFDEDEADDGLVGVQPLLIRTETVLLVTFVTTRSAFPSPFRSLTATETGFDPVAKSILGANVPLLVLRRTETVLLL
jgi:hypothetical protein